jgi:type IV secretion system protein VirD4
VLVIDPKGENALITAKRRQEMGQDVHIVDPWGIVNVEGIETSIP